MTLLSTQLAQLAPQAKREMLRRAADFDLFPLSHGQERLWFLDRVRPGTPNYNMPARIDLQGALDVPLLESALLAAVERHESLRTAFIEFEGVPMQLVQPAQHSLRRVDLSALPDGERQAACEREVLAEARQPFSLEAGHLLRSTLIRLGPQTHVLLLTLHHIVCDDWSLGVLVREINAACAAHAPAAPLQIQYADYACWQREQLQGDSLEPLARHWKQTLAGAPGLLALPLDRPRPAEQQFNGTRQDFTLEPDLTRRVEQLARERNATPFMVFFAGFLVLLQRWTAQTDLVVATPIANRPTPELEAMVGLFFNTLVLRTDAAGDPSFTALVDRVRDVALQAYAHQDLPFVKLVELLQPGRALSHNPLVQVMFILQNAPSHGFELPGISGHLRGVDNGTAQFDLILSLRPQGEGMAGYVHYDTDLFDAGTMRRLVGHFKTLLQGACSAPDSRLSTLPMLTPRELHQLRYDWNDTAVPRPAGLCLHHLVERQVAAQPDAPAVLHEGGVLSRGELDRRANSLAHALRALGAGPQAAVGICLRPGPDMVVALLAAVKSGSAYVPLDPDYPPERLAYMLRDAGVAVLVSAEEPLQRLPALGLPLLRMDAPIAEGPGGAPAVQVHGDDLAYVIYTSGTTGQPKGVMIRHAGIVNNLLDLNESFAVGPADRVLALSSFSFDMCVYETFGILAAGGALVIPHAGQARDPAHWVQLVQQHGVSLWNSAPALLEMLVRHVESVPGLTLPSLRGSILGGDWVAVNMPARFQRVAPGARFDVLGGATEASIHSITETVTRVDPAWTSIPYGKPMANQRAQVLDAAMQPVPVGVVGELYLGGLGLARGYWARPALTAERFVPDPCSDQPGARLYRTGDLARWREDGTLVLIGRLDHQVKIRGHRIELGEVEAALREHPAVRQAVAGARADGTGEKRLLAWLVLHEGQQASPAEVLALARAQLPAYMLPAQVMLLDRLPLSPNGKVDRAALTVAQAATAGTPQAAPATPLQSLVAGLFAEVLGLEQVGLHEDFFDLGGHSLRATQLTAQVREWLQMELPLRSFLAAPTVAAVAAELERIASSKGVALHAVLDALAAAESLSADEVAA